MELKLQRIARKPDYTIGRLFVNGRYSSDTLEDRVRDLAVEVKVPGETAIPTGRYRVIVNVRGDPDTPGKYGGRHGGVYSRRGEQAKGTGDKLDNARGEVDEGD